VTWRVCVVRVKDMRINFVTYLNMWAVSLWLGVCVWSELRIWE